MNIKKTLQNPFVLMAQGFVAGAILFFSTTQVEVGGAAGADRAQTAAVVERIDA